MRMTPIVHFVFAFVALTFISTAGVASCAKTPPDLTPEAVQAFKATQMVKALDVLRDVAISANEQKPPLISTDDTRKVVLYHQSSLKIIQASTSGWRPAVQAGLDELLKNLSDKDKRLLEPYVVLIKTVLAEVTR